MSRAEQIAEFLNNHLSGYTQYPLAGDASFRRYIRVKKDTQSFMLMDAPPAKENIRPFMAVCSHLCHGGFSAPNMMAHDVEKGFLLLEDLGDDTFSRLLRADISQEKNYYTAAVELLADWHSGTFSTANLSLPVYDNSLLSTETKLFSNWFLPQILEGEKLVEAQASYLALWESLMRTAPLAADQFVHRDYHADNLMWLPQRGGIARVGLLDFQDAVMGDAAYDLVSLLEDARRDVPADLAHAMISRYLDITHADKPRFAYAYALLAAQRNSKIVGIFTRLAARDGKANYLDYLPRVWAHLARDVEHPELSSLKAWLNQYVSQEKRGVITISKNADDLGLAA